MLSLSLGVTLRFRGLLAFGVGKQERTGHESILNSSRHDANKEDEDDLICTHAGSIGESIINSVVYNGNNGESLWALLFKGDFRFNRMPSFNNSPRSIAAISPTAKTNPQNVASLEECRRKCMCASLNPRLQGEFGGNSKGNIHLRLEGAHARAYHTTQHNQS